MDSTTVQQHQAEWGTPQVVVLLLGLALAVAAALRFQHRAVRGGREGAAPDRLPLPPGPRPLPVFGNLFLVASLKRRHADLYEMAQKYGPIMWLRLGSQGAVVVQSVELAEEVLKHQDSTFASRPPCGYAVGLMLYDGKDVGFAPFGPFWRFMRKVMTMELLSAKRIADFQHVRTEELGRMVDAIRNHLGQPVDLGHLVRSLTLNNITRMGMSKAAIERYEVRSAAAADEKDADSELVSLVNEALRILGVQAVGDVVPWLSFMDALLLPKAAMERTKRRLSALFTRTIQEHREQRACGPDAPPRDLVDVLLATAALPDGGGAGAITEDVIAAQLSDTIFAGSDTSANTTEWAMAELVRQPALLARAVREVEQLQPHPDADSGDVVAEADLARLHFLHAVVKETLRLHPPAPMLLPHYSTADAVVGGYRVPAGTTVLVNAWGLARDPAFWPHPHQFLPDRFLDGGTHAHVHMTGHHFQLLPFGAGKRVCPGIALGLAMVHRTLATLLHAFAWSLPPDVQRPQDLDMSEHSGLALTKAVSLNLVPHPKQQSS